MKGRLNDLRSKEVITVEDGVRLGYVCDVELDTTEAKLTGLVIYGKLRFFGLFGKSADRVIPWENVKTVGDDTILVHYKEPQEPAKKRGWLDRIFS